MPEKKKCFVIGPIGKSGSETRRDADFLLRGIIRPAIEAELNLHVWRADEDSKPGMITDKVINDINDSDLVIADLSELNPNAFYELGIRHAAGKPTIHMAADATPLPFDNMGHRTIFFNKADWESIETAKRTLLEQTKLCLSDGYETSNPVTQALNAKAFNASANTEQKQVSELIRRISNVENYIYQERGDVNNRIRGSLSNKIRKRREFLMGKILELADIFDREIEIVKIENFIENNIDDKNYDRVMELLERSDVSRIFHEIHNEIPF